jgi:general secretion pathway protein H
VGLLPTFRSKKRRRKMNDAAKRGFTLLEMVCVLAIIALLAAVLLPFIPRETSRSGLQAYALQAATLLKADRDAAISRNISVATLVDAGGRAIRSGASRALVRVPDDVRFEAVLPRTCQRQAARSNIRFFANGTSCGGSIALSRFDARYEVRVNWLTGRVEVVSSDTPIN